ncbi:MAG: RpiB/LacA/LacB family sugar-phosphate isomerase [Bacteroidales bacterium]|nr:RpiB/LacA/LacB family sugar-phosphate isomerase [Bacteroidales bacterium]
MDSKTIAIGCDPNAQGLKEIIIDHVKSLGYQVEDFGSDDKIYANTAYKVGKAIMEKKYERGILMCGTGLGMSLAANKIPGVYATCCNDVFSAERSIKSNNANVLTFGPQVIGPELAKKLVTVWLSSQYDENSRSQPKNERIYEIEKKYFKNE